MNGAVLYDALPDVLKTFHFRSATTLTRPQTGDNRQIRLSLYKFISVRGSYAMTTISPKWPGDFSYSVHFYNFHVPTVRLICVTCTVLPHKHTRARKCNLIRAKYV